MAEFSPPIVHDAAANLFWRMAEISSLHEASDEIMRTHGRCLMSQPFSSDILGEALEQSGFDRKDRDTLIAFGAAVGEEVVRHCRDEKNLDGIIYAEDADGGRSPSALSLDTKHLAVRPANIEGAVRGEHQGPAIEKMGRLCLRHPLPAVLFAERRPEAGIIEVLDTKTALGFDMPMLLAGSGIQQIADDLFVLLGTFYVPVPSVDHGDRWRSVIQNATFFRDSATVYSGSGTVEIRVRW